MSKNLAVFRIQPVKEINIGLIVAHHNRTASVKNIHIDQNRSKLNMRLIGSDENTRLGILNDIQSYKKSNKRGTIVAAEGVLTAGVDFFDENFKGWRDDSSILQPWLDANIAFLKSGKVGKVSSAVLHLDETAPHIHFVTIPVCKVHIKNRYTERFEERNSYRTMFSDSVEHLAFCRKNGTTSTETKLGKLQTEYARAVEHLGLQRGVSSKKKHITPREYRERIAAAEIKLKIEKSDMPELSMLDKYDITIHGKNAKVFQGLQEKINEEVENRVEISRGTAAVITQNKQLKENITILEKSLQEKDVIMQQQADIIKSNTDKMQSLRQLEPSQLLHLMNYTQKQIDPFLESGRKWNAVNVVMGIEGMDFKSATQALLIATGNADAVSAVAAEAVKQSIIEPVATHNNIIKPSKISKVVELQQQEVSKELEAVNADKYRITLMSFDKPTINLGKSRTEEGTEKFYTAKDIIELIPTLAYRNAKNYNIFITPIPTDNKHFLLIDDLKNIETIKEYKPALILKSSPNSMQALLKVQGDYDNEQLNSYFKQLNRNFGDPKITGAIHPLRLAGFTNRKPKYKDPKGYFPFVSLIKYDGGFSEKAQQELNEIKIVKTLKDNKFVLDKNNNIQINDKLKQYAIQFYASKNGGDMSKIDFALASKLFENHIKPAEIAAVIAACSPAIDYRHKGQVDKYITTTLNAVLNKAIGGKKWTI